MNKEAYVSFETAQRLLNDKAILGWIEDEEADKFIGQYLKEIEL